jgi:hypothetical protein
MKYLSEYTEQTIAEAMKKAGAFFAFSNKQFDEVKKEGVKYVDCGMGLICPKDTATTLLTEINEAHAKGIEQDIKENGLVGIIKRELNNHECYYTGNTEDAENALKDYPIKPEDIRAVFKNKNYVIAVN